MRTFVGIAGAVLWRTENAEEALEYMLKRLPQNIQTG